jgi:outer membrane protein TolC
VQADSTVQIANGRLANAMGLHVSQTVKIIEPKISEGMHRQELADIEQLLDEAARNRPELRAALAQIEIQRAAVRSAKARYWPTVTAGGDFGWLGRTFPPSMNQWNLGLGVDWSLFTGFDRTYQLQASKANLAQAIAERENLLRGIELEVWTAYHQIIESSKAIDAAGRFVASAEENARVAEGEYKNGTGSIIALTDAQTSRSVARAQLVRARLDWYTAMARFERAVGRTLATPQNTAADKPKEAQK